MPFAVLQEEDLHGMLQPINNFRVPQGTEIIAAHASATSIFTVRRGYVKLQQDLPSGRRRIVRLLGSGEVVGLEGLHEPRYRHAALAMTEVDMCEIPVSVVHQMEQRRPELYTSLQARWDASLMQADQLILSLLSGEATTRVARLLNLLSEMAMGAPPPRMTRQDMAAILDISPETASRVCSQLLLRGWLRESDTSFAIDREQMQRLAAD
ncbi:MAG TPA: Crp/Fnr family transcriptional regulator [Xanthomonadales bacterium]|nr:Crp/Fnr family transcriptional regulator [Xanthomonadales bacterium]